MPETDSPPAGHFPRWLKRERAQGERQPFYGQFIQDCDWRRSRATMPDGPNRMECYARKTATFMILGEVCTRRCGFCHVAKGKTQAVDPSELPSGGGGLSPVWAWSTW